MRRGPITSSALSSPPGTPTCWQSPLATCKPLDGTEGVRVWRTRHTVYGTERTVLVTWNRNLFNAQTATLLCEIAKCRQCLRELQLRLRRWRNGTIRTGRPPTLEGTRKKIDGWLAARHIADLFRVQLEPSDPAPRLTFRFNRKAWQKLQETLLGKTLIFTDNHHWSDLEILCGYRAQYPRQRRIPEHEGQQPHRHPAPIPLDRPEDPGPRLLLCPRPVALVPSATPNPNARLPTLRRKTPRYARQYSRGRCPADHLWHAQENPPSKLPCRKCRKPRRPSMTA